MRSNIKFKPCPKLENFDKISKKRFSLYGSTFKFLFYTMYVVFILKVLDTYNENNHDKYNISPILREDKIIKITISKNKRSFTIMDSYCMLADSLNELGNNFEVDTLKSVFPYKFSTEDHLFYKGNTPDISYYENISKE